ncbi:MAG: DevR family CRISPR-associated autoregulator [Anaerolineae bacterium]|nr:DevR family CRISPR-associated autoregulator [Anaerolineae bacterium]
MTIIKSVSIAARVVLEMHALNNEGNESNRLMTRQVGIVTPVYDEAQPGGPVGYEKAVVNAISGDMNKHMFADAFRHIALEAGMPLCDACKALDPARMMGNPDFREYIAKKPPVNEVIDRLIGCAVDDVCGIMVTGEGTSVKRKSAIEFGWTVGLPNANEVQEFIHARHAITRLTRTKATRDSDKGVKDQAQNEKQQNIGQMIFNRPASSGVYAFVAHLDACAIGFNDASQNYPIDKVQRLGRLRAALLALGQVLLQPKGALTSTQMPHVVDVQGFVSLSQSAAAAPLISPLTDNFIERGLGVGEMLNRLHGQHAVQVQSFAGAQGLLESIDWSLADAAPGVYREG